MRSAAAVPSPSPASDAVLPDLPPDVLSDVLRDGWEAVTTPVVIADDHHDLVYANPAALAAAPRLATDTRAALREPVPGVPESLGGQLPPDRGPLARALAGETVLRQECPVPSDGEDSHRRYLVSAYPLPPRAGRRLALVAWSDAPGGWGADHERRSTLERLSRLIDGADEHAILMLDPDGRVLTWSRSAERLSRYRDDQVLGQPFSIFFTEQDRADGTPERILHTARTDGRAVTHGARIRGDGTRFWARGVITAVRDGQGRLEGFVKVTHDVSEEHEARARIIELNEQLEQANAELERVNRDLVHANASLEEGIAGRTQALERRTGELAEANRELEAFAYSVSHDLRAPARVVAGFAELLAEGSADRLDEDGRRYLGHVREAATDMGELIEGLLRLFRLQRQPLRRDPVDMTELARTAWADTAAGEGFTFVLGDLPSLTGDGRLLLQVWRNLFANAVKYSGRVPSPRIEVSGWVEAGHAGYEVRDNGVGFDPELSDGLFTPFRRLHPAGDFPGTGLGLAIVHRIVQRHGGRVTASSAPGEGAVFTITLER